MINYDCCDRIRELNNRGYIDGELIYLQRPSVNTGLPLHLRDYVNCLSCGQQLSIHPGEGVPDCLTFRNGKLLKYIIAKQQVDPTAGNDEYVFNLVTRNEFRNHRLGNPDYPEQITIDFCPYCGHQYKGRDLAGA